jgi:hypothetical protein
MSFTSLAIRKYTGNNTLRRPQNRHFGRNLPSFDQKWSKWPLCRLCSAQMPEYFCMVRLVKVMGKSQTSIQVIQNVLKKIAAHAEKM